jgi:hypothetical protein
MVTIVVTEVIKRTCFNLGFSHAHTMRIDAYSSLFFLLFFVFGGFEGLESDQVSLLIN